MVKTYINMRTGEIIPATNWKLAYEYFKADGKVCGYKVRVWDIRRYR